MDIIEPVEYGPIPIQKSFETLKSEKPHQKAPPGHGGGPSQRNHFPGILDVDGWISPSYRNIDSLPPIEIDVNGLPIRPPSVSTDRRRRWNEEQRKIRFLLMYNYTGGVLPLCCQEAGITERLFEHWLKDPKFKACLERQRQAIVWRAVLRLQQRLGLVPCGEKINIATINVKGLMELINKLDPTYFGGEKPDEPDNPNLPRALRPER